MSKMARFLAFLAVSCSMLLSAAAFAQAQAVRPIPGELLVRYKKGVGPSDRALLHAQMKGKALKRFDFIDVEHIKLDKGVRTDDAIRKLKGNPKIEYAEPNYEVQAFVTPNDARFPELYGMRNTGQTGGTAGADIKATSAWDVFTGNPNLLLGVIDTGIDYNHPDLIDNVWTNPGEIPGNSVDDDNNGYVDDVHGYDFVNNDGDPFDDNGHGSHCAGTIAGTGNNSIGVVGVNWRAKVAGIKFLNSGGSGSTAAAISGVQYSIVIGCKLTSNSWGGGGFSQALLDAINAAGAANQLFVAAAGNSTQNTDVTPSYPASYNSPYIISVAATDHNDNLASFSNFGATSVDLAAPGVNILSLQPGGGYRLLSGTSMATPHVAGGVALAMGRFPNAPNTQIKQLILNSVDVKPQLAGKCLTGGRLNVFLAIADPDETPPGAVANLSTANPGSNTMGLAWTATGDDGNTGRASSYEIRYSTSPITDLASFQAGTLVPGPDPQPSGSSETVEVAGLSFNTAYYFALRARDEFGNAGALSNVATGTTLGEPNLSASPASFSANLLTGGVATQTLTVSNTGQGTLDWTIPIPELNFSQPAPQEPTVIGKGNDDWRIGPPVLQGSGGPDGFGYRWKDSNEPGGPLFSWIDISATGTQIPLTVDDGFAAAIPMGMDFPFYGSTFNTLRLHSNGFLSFTTTTGAFDDNQPLPSSGGAANLVAPFWDDLDFRTTAGSARAYYHNDGTRLVVSWVNVPHFVSSGTPTGPYTFQAILYPTGEIVFQYLNMNTPTNSATAGIQNAARDVGLTVAFNTSYVANNLAVRIAPLRQWLTVTPSFGRVHSGQSQDVTVRFDATGLDGGLYTGAIEVNSNDPGGPSAHAAQLSVTGAPDLAVNPASFDFGTLFVGAAPTKTMTVSNPGTAPLDVTAIQSSDPTVTVDQGVFTLAPRAARNVIITYHPTSPGALNATLTLQSNDPDTPSKLVPVVGNAVPAPVFAVNPESFDVSLLTNTATTRNLRVSNSGGSNFVFTAEPIIQTPSGTVVVQGDADNVDLPKDAPDVLSGPVAQKSGGPDVFGYTYQDSDEPGGPTFSWVDISATGTLIPFNGDDQNLGPFPIGFSFPYYGATQTQFKLCTNGWLTFTTTNTQTTFTNTTLPNTGTSVPPNMLAMFWDDLDFRPAEAPNARVYYQYDGTRLIIQFKSAERRLETVTPSDFEMILYPNGTIVYQYLAMNMTTKNSATIGMQNATRNDGLQVVFNAAYVKNALAVRFRPPARFLTVNPTGGTVPPGGFVDLTVGFNAGGLFGGDYAGAVRIAGNDPVLPTRDIPALLHVTGVPDIATAPASLDFGIAYLGFPQLRQISVQNNGTDALNVSGISFDDPAYGVDQSSFSVPPLGNALLFVSFNPTTVGPRPATMTIASNDPDTPAKAVPLTGQGLVAPDVRPDPASLSASQTIPGSVQRTLTLYNDGGSDLNFVVGTQLTASSVTIHESLDLEKEENDPRPGILGSGGPDQFGYRWRDSDDPGGPAFDWVDITGIGTPVTFATGDDANSQNHPIGFNFPYYGGTFNSVNICTNGWISFTATQTSFNNQPLPTNATSTAPNMIAAFWDDLNPGTATPRVYRYSDGTRFIVSYVGVPRLTSGGPYTFQIILYPSGRIVYQYLDMQGTRLNEATVGIQNATKTDGLTVAFNAPYVHNGLAVEIATIPEYLTVSPTTGTIPAGGSANVIATFNTTGLFGGAYDGALRITSNDPDEPLVSVPTHLTAIGVPDVAAVPASLDFGSVYIGLTKDLPVSVRSVGSDVLNVTGVSFDNPAYSLVSPPSFPVSVGFNGSLGLTVRFTPNAPCAPCTGNLLIASNDPDAPSFAVPLSGAGVVPPEIEVSPSSMAAALATTLGPTAIQKTKKLVIANTGGSDLDWTAAAFETGGPASQGHDYIELAKAEDVAGSEEGVDPRPGILGSGGPDAFGYTWKDSDDPGGPTYQWVDISTIGTDTDFPDYALDSNVGPYPIGFAFPFYGQTFTEFHVCDNGWISFTNGTSTAFTNQPLPNAASGVPENMLAVWWDDMIFDSGDNAYVKYHNDGTRLIIEYFVRRIADFTPPHYNFQIILYPNGDIVYQYKFFDVQVLSSTIGIHNGTKTDGLTVVHNAAYVHPELAIKFSSRPSWLTVAPFSGTVEAGAPPDTVMVTFNATELEDGDYTGLVRIGSNDLDEPSTSVPVSLHVGVAPAVVAVNPNTLNRNSNGNFVSVAVTPPAPATPEQILTSSLLLQRSVPVDPQGPVDYEEGIAYYKFDRADLLGILPEGDAVSIEAIGEVEDVTWFSATDEVRLLKPHFSTVFMPGGRTRLSIGSQVNLQWTDPVGHTPASYDMSFSADGGITWLPVFTGRTQRNFQWTVPAWSTDHGMLELVAVDAAGPMGVWLQEDVEILPGVTGIDTPLPKVFALKFSGPNPAPGRADIELALPTASGVEVRVHDVRGAVVRHLVDGNLEAGIHRLRWDGRDAGGRRVSAGVYFVRAVAGREQGSTRLVMLP
ncbi:MAG TPA: S8 family serine peptidase [Candidatus Eisenbacteria bacterium]|nr:S8 family serine peptidase [Candidatus Eisenbacteria bacterium]